MSNSSHFLDAFSSIEKWLRTVGRAERSVSFNQLVETAARMNKMVAAFRDDLKEYADLRNAIVHERSGGRVIAEPNRHAVSELQRIKSILLTPPKVLPMFQGEVETKQTSQALGDAVVAMLRGSFSQVPVVQGGRVVGVLTANAIARWLGHEVNEDVFSLRETPIAKVLAYTEDRENHAYLRRSSTLFDLLFLFEDFTSRGKDLDAVLITANGKAEEKLLGIVTVSDLPSVLRHLGLKKLSGR
jgi:predicted transcriptional regulator